VTNVNSWETLHKALQRLDAGRGKAFEEFIARLFEAETRDRYYVASTGSQPSGDARDERGSVAIQTKAYFGATRFRKDEAVLQLQHAIQALPELDIYVLAATKDPSQLRDELAWMEKEFAIEILLLHLGPKLTVLSALAVSHWQIAEQFLRPAGGTFRVWAQKKRRTAKVRKEVQKLRRRLSGASTQVAFQRKASELIQRRVASVASAEGTFNPIDLRQAISRRLLQEELFVWWNSAAPENAALIGDEGMGKTWVAAEFANELSQRQYKIVLWLNSSSWNAAGSVAEVLDRALKLICLPGDRLFEAYRRKILRRWQGPLLIVLDGANESNAWRAAAAILEDYFNHHEQFRGRIRLLFTTRRLPSRSSVADFWRNSRQLPVEPFSPGELDQALTQFAPEISARAIDAETREFIRTPMHFRTFLQYKERLASVRHLDKRLLLWVELEERFSHELEVDSQVTAIRKATNASLSDVLAKLAQTVMWSAEGQPSVPMAEVLRCIPAFHQVRDDLRAQNIITSNDVDFARLSLDHVILALALLLRREAEIHATEPLDTLHDLLRARLEPLPSTDDKVRAIHLAVLLSFIRQSDESSTAARAALLTLWLPQRNANLREDELAFFLGEDFEAFIAAVEWSFRTFLPGDFETTLIAPLARKWKEQGTSFTPLTKTLQRWLPLIFPGDISGSKNRNIAPPPEFSVAASEPQLRLSYAAISVLSLRPEVSLLRTLFDCYRSHAFCFQDSSGPGKKYRFLVKDAYDHLGILFRWHLDEREWIQGLANVAGQVQSEGGDVLKVGEFARLIRVASLPTILGNAKDVYIRGRDEEKSSVDYLRSALAGETGPPLNCLSFEGFARDAVRRDLPCLNEIEVQQLVQFAWQLFREHSLKIAVHNTFEQQIFVHLLPWLARYSPDDYHALTVEYALIGVAAKNPAEVFYELDGMLPVHDRGPSIVAAMFDRMPILFNLETFTGFVGEMTETVLLHGSAEQLTKWTEWVGTKPHPRGGLHVNWLPLPTAFTNYGPTDFFGGAREHATEAIEAMRQNSDDKTLVHTAKHWLHLASYAPHEPISAEWAFSALEIIPRNPELEWPIVYFLIAVPDIGGLRRALADTRVTDFLEGEDGSFLALRLVNNPQSDKLEGSEIDRLPLSAAGLIYWRRDDTEGLRRWGQRLCATTLAFLQTEPPPTTVVHRSHREADDAGLMHGFGVEIPSGGYSRSHFRGSSAWGVDRHSESPAPTDEEVDRLFDEFHHDLDRLRAWSGRELAGFNASPALSRWAELEPDRFETFLESFFVQLETAGFKTFQAIGTIAWCIAAAMVKTDPRGALDLAERWQADWSFRVVTLRGLCTIVNARLWSSKCDVAPGIGLLRRELCDRAQTDEEIFVQALAASKGGTQNEMVVIAKERLASPRARDRALGITLLAFVSPERDVGELLKRAADNDESYWVRDQAEWAQEALAIEASCRNRYLDLLRGPHSLENFSIGLAELRFALTPLANAWRFHVEEVAGYQSRNDRPSTYLELFWYHWEHRSESHRDVKIADRKLRDFCRGEKLKDGVTSRMAPWWNLD
jgi:hypothetical protein